MPRQQSEKYKILVVDDNDVMRTLLRQTLLKNNYDVIEATNGKNAIERYNDSLIDLILMDVDMPVLDGFEACNIIRSLPTGQYIPIMIVTGMNDFESINKAFEVGATDFLTKPINYGLISYRVRNLIRNYQNYIELEKNRIKLKNAQHAAQLGMWNWEAATDETTWSEELYYMCHVDSGAAIYRQDKLLNIVHPDDKLLLENSLQNCFQHHTPYTLEYRIITPNKAIRFIREAINISLDEFGNFTGITGSVLDISDLKSEELRNRALKDSFARFVPTEFLKIIGANAENIRAGDWIKKDMTVMLLDIRNFSSLAESVTDEKTFSFINLFFKKIEMAILNHKGFIDKYIGDAVMALFDSADNAIKASLQALDCVKDFNETDGKKIFNISDIKVGIALNTGALIMGVIGSQNRAECTVISDSVNFAFRLEEFNKLLGTTILMSHLTAKASSNFDSYSHRMLGKFKVRGKEKILSVYELLVDQADKKMKNETKVDFEIAIIYYQEGNFALAEVYLQKVLAHHPTDQAARFLMNKIKIIKTQGISKTWDGVVTIDQLI